jgi:hypothetical protein
LRTQLEQATLKQLRQQLGCRRATVQG